MKKSILRCLNIEMRTSEIREKTIQGAWLPGFSGRDLDGILIEMNLFQVDSGRLCDKAAA